MPAFEQLHGKEKQSQTFETLTFDYNLNNENESNHTKENWLCADKGAKSLGGMINKCSCQK